MVAGKGRPGLGASAAATQPSVRAWVAAGAIDARGARCASPENSALTIVAVSVYETCSPRIEERKLLRNPEARRQVLAQILDYARIVQEEWPRAALAEKLREHPQWVHENEEERRQCCRCGDFLLMIGGDRIDDGLMQLARRFAGKDDPLSLTELALVSMALYSLDTEYLLVPHVVNVVQRSERELTVRVIVQDVHGREIPADVVRDVQDEAAQASRGRLPVREEVIEFLRKAREPLDAALLPAHPEMARTAKPRKSLEYALTLDDDSGAVFKIHFGGYEKEAWSSIQVGLMLGTGDTAGRDAWRKRIEAVINRLPAGTRIDNGGPRTVNALTTFEWSTGEDLNDLMLSKVTETLMQFVSVLTPILRPKHTLS
ncbi:hypothetical protein KEG38_20280 [Polyangium jinanense]|uniref:hypothetical protein n=1 Tax=Polyangium jinanense TaxID=2829994 RepID=UPI00234197AE|nr:hypothetical protein [Polyangium jinanense]MDC3956210.1 hypothetical protein [Polyangium jinanense]